MDQQKSADVSEVTFSDSTADQEKLIVSVNKSQSTMEASGSHNSFDPSASAGEKQEGRKSVAPYDRTAAGVMPFSEDAEPQSLKQQ